MIWNFFSFFLNHEEPFLEINTNILETNIINISILVGILIYANKVSFAPGLENRRNNIIQVIENAQTDVLNASNYYYLAEKGFTQSLFWLQSWKNIYQQEKINVVNTKYNTIKQSLNELFSTTENLIINFEKKSFISLQRYILFVIGSRILRKFLFLSELEKSKLIEVMIYQLGGNNK